MLATLTACTTGTTGGNAAPPPTFGGGSPWVGSFAAVVLPPPVNSLTDVACATASRCWAVGSTVGGAGAPNGAAVIATVNRGATWSNQVIPPQVGYLSRVACSDQRHCTAVGQAAQTSNGQAVAIATVNGGSSWILEAVPPGILDITAVTCRPNRSCIAIGTTAGGAAALVSTSSASGWQAAGPLPAGMSGATAIDCTDAAHCWVTAHTAVDADHVAGAVALTTDGGTAWAAVALPKGLGYLNGVSCIEGSPTGSGAVPTTTSVAVPTTAPVSTTAPGTPTTAATTTTTTTTAPPTTTTAAAPVVGVAGARCTVVGTTSTSLNGARTGHGILLTSANGGASWADRAVTPSSASLADVSCTAIGSCVTVGSTPSASAAAGLIILTGPATSPWKSPATLAAPQPLTAVSCTSLAACVVVGESISEHLSGG